MTAVDERSARSATPRRQRPRGAPLRAGTPAPAEAGSWRPTRSEWFDAALLGSLCAAALFGFRTAFGGSRYLVAAAVGLLAGLAIAHVCARRREPAVVVAAISVLTFFLLGAAAVPDGALLGVLPSPATALDLVDGAVQGWAKLLTTVPPVGAAGALQTVPYLVGLVAGVLVLTISRRTRLPLLALVVPLAVLALTILFGTAEPASLVVQGAVFVALAIAWISWRTRKERTVDGGGPGRGVGSMVMLLVIGVGALLLGPHLPLTDARPRVTLRDRSDPPFDPREHPSPLTSFRRYLDTSPSGLAKKELFTVDGLPEGARLRLATMSSYDGVTFNVASGGDPSDGFERVGSDLPARSGGEAHRIHVTVQDYRNVWVPDVGELVGIEFGGAEADELEEDFRYNLRTGTGALLRPLRQGDSYTLDVIVPEPSPLSAVDGAAGSSPLSPLAQIEPVSTRAGDVTAAATTAAAQVAAIAALLTGEAHFLSDGAASDPRTRAGHGAKRLAEMVRDGAPAIGNAEQYASLAALMSAAVGVPARVVMGFAPKVTPSDATVVRGADVSAWIEVEFDDVGWVAVTDVVPTDRNLPAPQPEQEQQNSSALPPPPPPVIPPADASDVQPDPTEESDDPADDGQAGGGVPRIVFIAGGVALAPFLAVGGVTAAFAAVKARRRRRRRSTGPPATRIASGWVEMTDLARDLGEPVPTRATRREAADLLAAHQVETLARQADGAIFGPDEVDDGAVGTFWEGVDRARRSMLGELSPLARWRATVSTASLRRVTLRR